MRAWLSTQDVGFLERNLREDPRAAEDLKALLGKTTVPAVVVGDQYVIGYDPERLEALLSESSVGAGSLPPRDSLERNQGSMAAAEGLSLAGTIADLLERVREELAYSAAKGDGPYRRGMEDGLHFAEDALVGILERHSSDQTDSAD